ncbi:MAG: hypothetical protein AW08_01713 [Candidatus Accumulibacter adjunctus]|uniref:AAA domain-containing protein n=1 Tax=Candidatus Accumulibacter adjunctus TaxID=1454001 RepID=A0A011NT58_9PROT|nr:MAG: hypothetical protein AW08_01713 [Candidatus Accumulibacter adjunctus]
MNDLQGMVDADRRPGRFIVTGSQQFGLLAGVTQSLAGRVGMTRLLPLAAAEIPSIGSGQLKSSSGIPRPTRGGSGVFPPPRCQRVKGLLE